MKISKINTKQYFKIVNTLKDGFVFPNGEIVTPHSSIAFALLVEGITGLHISKILALKPSDIKIKKNSLCICGVAYTMFDPERAFLYSFLKTAIPRKNVVDMQVRNIQRFLKKTCDYLGYADIHIASFYNYSEITKIKRHEIYYKEKAKRLQQRIRDYELEESGIYNSQFNELFIDDLNYTYSMFGINSGLNALIRKFYQTDDSYDDDLIGASYLF